jgi:hypothetical protein
MHITDRERARGYFEVRAHQMLAASVDPQALIDREAARWLVTPITDDKPKENQHG